MQQVTLKQLVPYMKTYRNAGVSMGIIGPPGLGKTAVVNQFADSVGSGLLAMRIADKDVIDLKGLPDNYVDPISGKKFSRFLEAEFINVLDNIVKAKGSAILFLDEMLQANRSMQVIAQQLLNENRIGEHTLPKNVWKVFASNRMGDKAAVNSPSTATANRVGIVEAVPDHQAWHEWAVTVDILPEIVAFFKTRPDQLFSVLHKGFHELYASGEWVYCSPRSVENLSKLVKAHGAYDMTLCCSIVGDSIGAQLYSYAHSARNLPDLSWLEVGDVEAAKKCPCPEEPDLQYMAMYSVLYNCKESTQVQAAVTYINKFPREYISVFTKELVIKLPSSVLVLSRML
jgi:hypothetical protein